MKTALKYFGMFATIPALAIGIEKFYNTEIKESHIPQIEKPTTEYDAFRAKEDSTNARKQRKIEAFLELTRENKLRQITPPTGYENKE